MRLEKHYEDKNDAARAEIGFRVLYRLVRYNARVFILLFSTTYKILKIYNPEGNNIRFNSLFMLKRIDRILDGLKELKHTGNINIYLVNNTKKRLILSKGL